jgi:hypothetical protein
LVYEVPTQPAKQCLQNVISHPGRVFPDISGLILTGWFLLNN